MSPPRNARYWIEKMASRKTGYPVASLAYYGADNTFASKAVVGIIISEKDHDVAEHRRWFAETTDVRSDHTINQEILDFIAQHNVQRVVMVDRLIGCPHEEGVDYPEGEPCPQCPYWAHRDRWTGELINEPGR